MTHYRGWTISAETGPNASEMFRVRKMAANGVTALAIGPRFASEAEASDWIDEQQTSDHPYGDGPSYHAAC